MIELPLIEWPEKHDPTAEQQITNRIINLLASESHERLGTNNLCYLIGLHPAHNVTVLTESLTTIDDYHRWKSISYGYKNRGWGLVFSDISSFPPLLPVLFSHGAENLVIAAINNSYNIYNDDSLPKLAEEIVLGITHEPSHGKYLGLLFDCERLTKIFE